MLTKGEKERGRLMFLHVLSEVFTTMLKSFGTPMGAAGFV